MIVLICKTITNKPVQGSSRKDPWFDLNHRGDTITFWMETLVVNSKFKTYPMYIFNFNTFVED
ncbi:MAG: hypothetical protein RIQ78_733 [Bacteroidota bacterium]|jgi:hypothetical protein